jgi:N-methylhydantoinase B
VKIDHFTVSVIQNALISAAEEMSLVVKRSARSPLLREAGDLSSALMDSEGNLVAQGHDLPAHLGVISFTVKEFLKHIAPRVPLPGDVWVLNIPQIGGSHLPDIKVIKPIFADDGLIGFAVQLAHWADIGGAMPGSYYAAATDSYMEGLRLPPLRIFVKDEEVRESIDVILANVRGSSEREGDLLAQVAATRVAERRIREIVNRYGTATTRAAMQSILSFAEAQMREVIAKIPDGEYTGSDKLDDGGPQNRPVTIEVVVRKQGSDIEFDFRESDDEISGPLNTTRFATAGAAFYVMKAIAGDQIPANSGCYRPIKVTTRENSFLDVGEGLPLVGGSHESAARVVDAVFRALEPVIGEQLTAGGNSSASLLIFGGRGRSGRWTTFYEPHGGGEGARVDRDGHSVVRIHLNNAACTPVEIIESEYLIRLRSQAVRYGSGGEGRRRGGNGFRREYEILSDDLTLTTMFERRVFAPYGFRGGMPGKPTRVVLKRPGQDDLELPGKTNVKIARGDCIVLETAGGGGYGAPEHSTAEGV